MLFVGHGWIVSDEVGRWCVGDDVTYWHGIAWMANLVRDPLDYPRDVVWVKLDPLVQTRLVCRTIREKRTESRRPICNPTQEEHE